MTQGLHYTLLRTNCVSNKFLDLKVHCKVFKSLHCIREWFTYRKLGLSTFIILYIAHHTRNKENSQTQFEMQFSANPKKAVSWVLIWKITSFWIMYNYHENAEYIRDSQNIAMHEIFHKSYENSIWHTTCLVYIVKITYTSLSGSWIFTQTQTLLYIII